MSAPHPGLSSPHICNSAAFIMPATPEDEAADEYGRCGWLATPASLWWHQKTTDGVHRLRFAAGGNVVQYKQAPRPGKVPDGDRGVVSEFSASSKFRLLQFVNAIDRGAIAPERTVFATLTYPGVWPGHREWKPSARSKFVHRGGRIYQKQWKRVRRGGPDLADGACSRVVSPWFVWKEQLRTFRMNLEKTWGHIPAVWKLEPQRRGAPHFHLILLMPATFAAGLERVGEKQHGHRRVGVWKGGQLSAFRAWCSKAWYSAVGSGDTRHLQAGTNVEPFEEWSKVAAYAAGYLGKDCEFTDDEGKPLAAGRFWGVWRKEGWPIRYVTRTLGEEHWIKIRRALRRYLEKQGRQLRGQNGRPPAFQWVGWPRNVTAFIPASIVAALVASVCVWSGPGWSFPPEWGYGKVARLRARIDHAKELAREMRLHL